jgi:hypothetical protein
MALKQKTFRLSDGTELIGTQGSTYAGFMFSLTALGGLCGGNYVDNHIQFDGGGGGATIPFSEGDQYTLYEIKTQTIDEHYIPDTIARTAQLGGVRFKIDGTDLQASLDGGSTWKTVTLI